jgi:hypothetical protein
MQQWTDYSALLASVVDWKSELEDAKGQPLAEDRTWYGYDTLANFWAIEPLMAGLPPDRLELMATGPIADIGGADGDLGYFFASRGLEVDLIDWPATNWNGLAGARALKSRLKADRVNIHEVNLDQQFDLPRERYELTFFLGILYHLKNPFFVMERLAERSRHCFLSTRIARQTADGQLELEKAPVAYLLDPDECNNDATNYWIFSEMGLIRLLDRCGWDVEGSVRVGDTDQSNPSGAEHDERIFLALRSRHFSS